MCAVTLPVPSRRGILVRAVTACGRGERHGESALRDPGFSLFFFCYSNGGLLPIWALRPTVGLLGVEDEETSKKREGNGRGLIVVGGERGRGTEKSGGKRRWDQGCKRNRARVHWKNEKMQVESREVEADSLCLLVGCGKAGGIGKS